MSPPHHPRLLCMEADCLRNTSDICISLPETDWKRHNRTLSSARQWFDRARDVGRSLFIHFGAVIPADSHISPHLHDSWKQLLEFMALYRLKELLLVYLALKLPDHTWQSIERLQCELAKFHWATTFWKLVNLRHLKIPGSLLLDGMDRIVPWHQLRTFEIGAFREYPVTPSSCLNMLRQSRLLEHCCIMLSKEPSSRFTFKSTFFSTEEKIVLANVDYFEAKFWDGLAVPLFLRPLIMPNITTFSLGPASSEELRCDMACVGFAI
ncbi:hypothetical protein F5887DRAFT_1073733 [Amanita rubescens]|nr:hypothetical protein F5887DRAFT_1073733 [Amanita rubescens]